MPSTIDCETPIYSSFANAPDIGEMIQEFVDEMPSRIESLTAAFNSRDWNILRRLAHQLKGSGGSYGFDELTLQARHLEGAIRDSAPSDGVSECFHKLVACCRRVRSGCPN